MPLRTKIRDLLFLLIPVLGGRFLGSLKSCVYFIEVSTFFRKFTVPYLGCNWEKLHEYLITNESLENADFDYLEFGVSKGGSFRFWLGNCKSREAGFYGFDTFTGIPEDWGSVKKGTYTTHGNIPEVNDIRANFIVGLFSDTLPNFILNTKLSRRKVIHLDADLYSSTLYVLIHLHPFIKKDDIIIFDEFFSVTKADHEFRAFIDYLAIYPLNYVPIAKSCTQLAIKVL